MKKLNTVASLFALAALSVVASSALAQDNTNNWRTADGAPVKAADNTLCWRDANWTPATANPACDGAPKPPPPAPAKVAPPPPPPPPPPPRPPAAPVSEKVTYAADAFFDFDKSDLKPEGKAKLDDLVGKLAGLNLEVIIAVGHTDSIGTAEYNQKLSVRRADAVKAYLASKGVEKNRIYTEGKGMKDPVASNKTAEGRAKNRRVEVELVGTRTKK